MNIILPYINKFKYLIIQTNNLIYTNQVTTVYFQSTMKSSMECKSWDWWEFQEPFFQLEGS